MSTTAVLLCALAAEAAAVAPLAHRLVPGAAPRAAPPTCVARTFADLGLSDEMCEALLGMRVQTPNLLQTQAIPAIAGRADVIVGAQTGSGKTLTYLVPLMQSLKADEQAQGARAKPKRPRALVLVPTRELALQVRDVARGLGKLVRSSVAVVHGGVPEAPQRKQFTWPVDVLVATPGRLLQHLDKARATWSRCAP